MPPHLCQDFAEHEFVAIKATREPTLRLPDLLPQFVEAEGRVVALVEKSLLNLVEPFINRLRRGVGHGVLQDAESSIVANTDVARGTQKFTLSSPVTCGADP